MEIAKYSRDGKYGCHFLPGGTPDAAGLKALYNLHARRLSDVFRAVFRLLNEIVVNGVAHQFGVIAQVHFFQDTLAVGANGIRAQFQGAGNP